MNRYNLQLNPKYKIYEDQMKKQFVQVGTLLVRSGKSKSFGEHTKENTKKLRNGSFIKIKEKQENYNQLYMPRKESDLVPKRRYLSVNRLLNPRDLKEERNQVIVNKEQKQQERQIKRNDKVQSTRNLSKQIFDFESIYQFVQKK